MENQSNGKVFFVNGKQRLSQQGKSYFFSQNFDLSEIIKTIGTSNCCATIAVPKTARDENDRVLVLKPAIERNNDKGSYQKQNNQSNNQSNSQNYSKNANQNANQPNKPSGNYHGNYQNNYQDNYQGNNQNNYKATIKTAVTLKGKTPKILNTPEVLIKLQKYRRKIYDASGKDLQFLSCYFEFIAIKNKCV